MKERARAWRFVLAPDRLHPNALRAMLAKLSPSPNAERPIYTILVPLYREAHMLPELVHGLTHLDWPAAKFDIKLILEAVDLDTIAAMRALNLRGNVEIVVVPELHRAPSRRRRTTPCRSPAASLVIFDAEDRPDPDQLRRAYAAFRRGSPNLACVQAALNIYNARDNWLTRQFTLEYCALFDALSPALDRLRLPVPLGGA